MLRLANRQFRYILRIKRAVVFCTCVIHLKLGPFEVWQRHQRDFRFRVRLDFWHKTVRFHCTHTISNCALASCFEDMAAHVFDFVRNILGQPTWRQYVSHTKSNTWAAVSPKQLAKAQFDISYFQWSKLLWTTTKATSKNGELALELVISWWTE